MEKNIRPSKIMYYLQVAEATSARSTCLKNHVGAVIVQNDQIVATGYNGAPRGRKNCIDIGHCYRVAHNIPSGVQYERCLDGNSRIPLAGGGCMRIADMARLPDSQLPAVLAYDEEARVVTPVTPTWVRATGVTVTRTIIHTTTGTISTTGDHLIMAINDSGEVSYTEAALLYPGFAVMGGRLPEYQGAALHHDIWEPAVQFVKAVDCSVVNLEDAMVYDMQVDPYHNFGVLTSESDHRMIFVHNCRSVHGEANAIIDADRSKMLGATLYIFQRDILNNCVRKNSGACQMCQRMIINAGIKEVIFADPDGIDATPDHYGYRVQQVTDWVTDESESPIG